MSAIPKPAIVLVHGAWADASGWGSVISELHGHGFTVYAPTNTLRGLPQDSAYVNQFLTQNAALQGQQIVLVGHSYGGAVITNAAAGVTTVRALVYVDAFIPDEGETIGELAAAEPGSCLGGDPAETFDAVPYPGGPAGDVDLYIKQDRVPGCFATGLPADQAVVIAATQRPLTASAFAVPSGPAAWKTIPSWAVVGTGDKVIPPAELTIMAKRARAQITEIEAGHLSLISHPSVVASVILKAVEATG
jgi:pimeloyl-ACP methyl ester carboxylesterase